MGERLGAGVNELFARLGVRAQCLGYGSLQQIQWTDAPVITLGDAACASQDIGGLRELLQSGAAQSGPIQRAIAAMFCISTPMGSAEIERALAALEAALEMLKPYMREVVPRLLAKCTHPAPRRLLAWGEL